MQILSVSDAISAVGGADRASEVCGVSLDAVRKWREKGCIPPKNWPSLVEHGADKLTYDALEALWRQAREAVTTPPAQHAAGPTS